VVGRETLIMEQKNDPELVRLAAEAMTEEEMNVTPEGYFKQSGGSACLAIALVIAHAG